MSYRLTEAEQAQVLAWSLECVPFPEQARRLAAHGVGPEVRRGAGRGDDEHRP
jgi:hypothetical protein